MKIKNFVTAVIAAALLLTGCAENRENINANDSAGSASGAGSVYSDAVSGIEEPVSSAASEVEETESSPNVPKPAVSASSVESKPEEKPVESTSATVEKPVASTSTIVEKPVSSSTSSKAEVPVSSSTTTSSKPASSSTSTTTSKPVSSSTTSKPSTPVSSSTTTSVSTSKPVEKPVHNCSTDGHVWNVTTTTTEPKWCREMHNVYDFGFDATLARRFLNTEESTYIIFKDTCKANGVSGVCGSATIDVEVWGTETFETKTCTICGYSSVQVGKGTINPIGEWRYIDGQNPRVSVNDRYNFNTLFYDPYNVPQVVIDNIRICKGL